MKVEIVGRFDFATVPSSLPSGWYQEAVMFAFLGGLGGEQGPSA